MVIKKQKQEKNLIARQPQTSRQSLRRRSDGLFGQPFLPSLWGGFLSDEAVWAPAIHVLVKDDKFVVKVELPGVHEEDVRVSVLGDMLIVEGEKETESEVKQKGYSYSETSYGNFSRSIAIPSIVDIDRIAANFDKGVLEIDLPKPADIKPKNVNVTAKKKPKTSAKEEPIASDIKKKNTKK